MNPNIDQRVVLTLDAGGTNFVFSAIQANKEIIDPIRLPSHGNDLEKCINTMEQGFRKLESQLTQKPVAISFAFPGPADYPRGIIGKLMNLTAFTGNIPLGPILEERMKLPVFINNDGDLFAYGEALSGFLPAINKQLKDAGISKSYKNLIGVTLGTGFGGGVVIKEQLLQGDNSMAAEVWQMRNRVNPETVAEEGVSIRAVQREFCKMTEINIKDAPTPKTIYEIAIGKKKGDKNAAIHSFNMLGKVLGDALSNMLQLLDAAIVIGGGLAGAADLILPATLKEMKSNYTSYSGQAIPRVTQKVFNLENPSELDQFLNWKSVQIQVPDTDLQIIAHEEARIPLGISTLGTSKAISLGAYAYALSQL